MEYKIGKKKSNRFNIALLIAMVLHAALFINLNMTQAHSEEEPEEKRVLVRFSGVQQAEISAAEEPAKEQASPQPQQMSDADALQAFEGMLTNSGSKKPPAIPKPVQNIELPKPENKQTESKPQQNTPKSPYLGSSGNELGNSTQNNAGELERYEQALSLWLNRFIEAEQARVKIELMQARTEINNGSGMIQIRINRTGRVLDYRIIQSTGSNILDGAMWRIGDKMREVPRVPREYEPMTAEFIFNLRVNFSLLKK